MGHTPVDAMLQVVKWIQVDQPIGAANDLSTNQVATTHKACSQGQGQRGSPPPWNILATALFSVNSNIIWKTKIPWKTLKTEFSTLKFGPVRQIQIIDFIPAIGKMFPGLTCSQSLSSRKYFGRRSHLLARGGGEANEANGTTGSKSKTNPGQI